MSPVTVLTFRPDDSRSRIQRFARTRSQGWAMRSNRSSLRGQGRLALRLSPASLPSRHTSRAYSTSHPAPSRRVSTVSRA
ncbi:hypothetical protein VM95_09050 [Streptomyces rubellomurinus]|uniref:Uncharacterized protein n=1 Tax=Streptomyces rubellomurinus (strain ATCC 31215) TaxID=359131 RepID=A0A0F2TKT8_STRR3|nr:hypothetical protein VM95_09050 [Streptomyces rubellomurinus]